MIRQPIITVLGHVDHGKTTLLDALRGTAVASREAGGITQAIGASIIPKKTLQELCGKLLETMKQKLTIPGLLFIDTPGHAAFTTLRKRGGSIADLAVLIIDLNEGVKPQTRECLAILKETKTPFVVAATKLDLSRGWHALQKPLAATLNEQNETTRTNIDTKLYTIVAQLSEEGFPSDRFDRVDSFTKTVAIVPLSSKTLDGIPELLAILTGLAQKYLEQQLSTDVTGPGKATILEVKEQKGLGTVLDVILQDGTLNVKDEVVVGTLNGPLTTKVKALLQPQPRVDTRELNARFTTVKTVGAATGVRVNLLNSEGVIAGMPLLVVKKNEKELSTFVQEQLSLSSITTQPQGIIIKADTIGSLEALSHLLSQHNIPVSTAALGPITKKDLADAEGQQQEAHKCIITFNIPQYTHHAPVKLLQHTIIYSLIDEYVLWVEELKKKNQKQAFTIAVKPAKIQLLKEYIFRQSEPAVIGCEVMEGILRPGVQLMNHKGETITQVKGIQDQQENKVELKKGERAALSLADVIIGRNLKPDAQLYVYITEEDYKTFKEHKEALTETEKKALKEIAEIMREKNPVWGV